jgi:hypothetical protein
MYRFNFDNKDVRAYGFVLGSVHMLLVVNREGIVV